MILFTQDYYFSSKAWAMGHQFVQIMLIRPQFLNKDSDFSLFLLGLGTHSILANVTVWPKKVTKSTYVLSRESKAIEIDMKHSVVKVQCYKKLSR